MGRWTLDYHDDVLRNKLKTLVAGSVKRAKLEKGEPIITYEAFVEELDEGDAFTSALIDVLVKEMAERRTRPNPDDRRQFIAERTAKALSLQASSRIYQSRQRRRFNFFDYAPPTLPSDDEEDSWQHGSSAPEGVRINTDLYDAYAAPSFPSDTELRHSEQEGLVSRLVTDFPSYSPDPVENEQPISPGAQSPPLSGFRNSFWGNPPSGSTSLHRTNSLRRSTRSRTDAFSDFTLRRRLATRQGSMGEEEGSRHDDPADGTWDFSSAPRIRPEDTTTSYSTANPHPHARRFFPLSAWTSARRRYPAAADIWGPQPRPPSPITTPSSSTSISTPLPPPQEAATTASSSTAGSLQSSSELWYSLTAGRGIPGPIQTSSSEPRRHSIGDVPLPSERRHLAPRLRRGGLRAPESLLSRYASPSMAPIGTAAPSVTAASEGSATMIEVSGRERSVPETSLSLTTGGGVGVDWDIGEESHQLLTPRSVSPPAEHS